MKLRTTLAVVLIVITLVVGGVVYGSFEFTKQNAIDRGQQNVNETALTVADQIETDLDERRDRVGFVASQPTASNFDETARTIDPFLENSRFYAAQILWANGTVVDSRGDLSDDAHEAAIGSNLSDEPYIQGALDGQTTVSDPLETNEPDEYILIISAPIYEGQAVVGVFSAAIELNSQTVLRSTEPLETTDQTVSVTAGETQIKAGSDAFDRSTAISSAAVVDATGWTVTVDRDRTGLESELQFMAYIQGLSLLVVLLSIVGLGAWEYRVNLSQTNRLLAGFQAVQQGIYDHRLTLKATDEWARISGGFNDLTAGIKQREDAIKEREQRLEVLNRVLRHNLRNDMAVIINYADMLPELVDDPDAEMASGKIVSMGRGLTELGTKAGKIEQAFQSAEDGLRTVDLQSIVDETVEEIRADHDVDISVSMGEATEVLALSTIAMAVENVCANAVDHNTHPDPVVKITVETVAADEVVSPAVVSPTAESADDESTGDETPSESTNSEPTNVMVDESNESPHTAERVRLTVVDNGPGIPEQEINVLTTGRETALEHGSGLGLWLVYWLAEKSEAELQFAEADLGGAAVSLVFKTPLADEADRKADEHTEPMNTTEHAAATETDSTDEDAVDGDSP